MSRYESECEDRDSKKKSSATAKTALGLAIGGLGLAAAGNGLFGGGNGCNNNGGLLGNILGGNNNSSYCEEKMERGERAVTEIQLLEKWIMPEMCRTNSLERFAAVSPYATELNMLEKYIFPLMGRTCNLEKEAAVNSAVDQKNQVINGLLFEMARNQTNGQFELADCRTNGKFELAQQNTDAKFLLSQALAQADLERATCNVVRGVPYISPTQMADPYQAGSNVLMAKRVNPVACAAPASPCCNDYSGAWSGCGGGCF